MSEEACFRRALDSNPVNARAWCNLGHTLKELGHDIVVNSPIGLAGPKDMDPKVVKVLHDAFRKATADPAYNRALEQNDQVLIYMGSEEYRKYAIEQTAREKLFVQELGIKLD